MKNNEKTDALLNDYFNEIYEKTINGVSRYVVSKCNNIHDVEDLLQNIYTRFYQRIKKKGFEDIQNAEAFIINIAKFEFKTYYGKTAKKKENVALMSDFSEEQGVHIESEMSKYQQSLEDVICDKMTAKKIFTVIANMDSEIGKIFYLYFVCDLKLDEIAEKLEMNLSTVKSKLYRTIEKQKIKYRL